VSKVFVLQPKGGGAGSEVYQKGGGAESTAQNQAKPKDKDCLQDSNNHELENVLISESTSAFCWTIAYLSCAGAIGGVSSNQQRGHLPTCNSDLNLWGQRSRNLLPIYRRFDRIFGAKLYQ
jgi:hypothetical protein